MRKNAITFTGEWLLSALGLDPERFTITGWTRNATDIEAGGFRIIVVGDDCDEHLELSIAAEIDPLELAARCPKSTSEA